MIQSVLTIGTSSFTFISFSEEINFFMGGGNRTIVDAISGFRVNKGSNKE